MTENKKIILRLLRKNISYYCVGISATCVAFLLISLLVDYISGIPVSSSLAFFAVLFFIMCAVGSTYLDYKFYKKWGKFLDE